MLLIEILARLSVCVPGLGENKHDAPARARGVVRYFIIMNFVEPSSVPLWILTTHYASLLKLTTFLEYYLIYSSECACVRWCLCACVGVSLSGTCMGGLVAFRVFSDKWFPHTWQARQCANSNSNRSFTLQNFSIFFFFARMLS